MSNNSREEEPESFPMNGGDGTYSYTKNSRLQRTGVSAVKEMMDEAITNKLDVKTLVSSSNTICIADLGCSVGPNTFIAVQNIIQAVKNKYLSQTTTTSQSPEFLVLFNDHVTNDFNTLFMSLPPERQYFAMAVPGSFHGRLFPEKSLQFIHSSYALHWLTRVPQECLDTNSPAWNKGRIHYTDAPKAVMNAYSARFAKDMNLFLDARAKELVDGGMMVLIMQGVPNDIPHSRLTSGVLYQFMESSIIDMAKAGKISEAQVDSFNIPVYPPTPKEMTEVVERNGCFAIETIEITNPLTKHQSTVNWLHLTTTTLRAAVEGVFAKHFGSEIIDEFFERVYQKTIQFSAELESSSKEDTQLFIVLKRN